MDWGNNAEGVRKIAITSDEPNKCPIGTNFPPGTTIHDRDELIEVQKDLRDTPLCHGLIGRFRFEVGPAYRRTARRASAFEGEAGHLKQQGQHAQRCRE